MSTERMGSIALKMEEPLDRLDGVRLLLDEMVDLCARGKNAAVYDLLLRNLSPDLDEIRRLWRELHEAADGDEPPLKSVKE